MEKSRTILSRLMSGEKIECPRCKGAIIEPYGTTPDKAHSVVCPKCDYTIRFTPEINIE